MTSNVQRALGFGGSFLEVCRAFICCTKGRSVPDISTIDWLTTPPIIKAKRRHHHPQTSRHHHPLHRSRLPSSLSPSVLRHPLQPRHDNASLTCILILWSNYFKSLMIVIDGEDLSNGKSATSVTSGLSSFSFSTGNLQHTTTQWAVVKMSNNEMINQLLWFVRSPAIIRN